VDGGLDQLALLDRLSNNLKKEHVLRVMLNCFVWGRILSAVQFAKTAGEGRDQGWFEVRACIRADGGSVCMSLLCVRMHVCSRQGVLVLCFKSIFGQTG
jgi:hypothetical protein